MKRKILRRKNANVEVVNLHLFRSNSGVYLTQVILITVPTTIQVSQELVTNVLLTLEELLTDNVKNVGELFVPLVNVLNTIVMVAQRVTIDLVKQSEIQELKVISVKKNLAQMKAVIVY